jgi:hypothetical protein
VAVVDQGGEVLATRNVLNGVKPILAVIGGMPAASGAAFGCPLPAAQGDRRGTTGREGTGRRATPRAGTAAEPAVSGAG